MDNAVDLAPLLNPESSLPFPLRKPLVPAVPLAPLVPLSSVSSPSVSDPRPARLEGARG